MFNIKSFLAKIYENMQVSLLREGAVNVPVMPQISVFESEELLGVGDDLALNNNPDTPDKEAELQAKRDFIQKKLDEIGNKRTFDEIDYKCLLSLKLEDLEKVSHLFYIDERKEQFMGYEIAMLAKLTDEQFERIKDLLNVSGRENQFSALEIFTIADLSDEEYKRAENLFLTKINGEEFDGHDLENLAKLSEDELDWAFKNLLNRDLLMSEVVMIAKNHSDEVLEFLDTHSDIEFAYTVGDEVKFITKGKYYTYNKSEVIETGEKNKIPDTEFIKNGTALTLFNKRLNVLQTVTEGEIPGKADFANVINESLIYYDDNGDVAKTINIEMNPESGVLNVFETESDGNIVSIQQERADERTGAKVIERHLTSPVGVKTDFCSNINNNLKTTDYKITDKDGTNLIYIHQTFEKIGENRFVSSINTTEDERNSQIYEIEYSDNNIVTVFDKSRGTTTEIDLNDYFTDEESIEKLMPYVKQLPGQVLLKLAESSFEIEYDDDYIQSGEWYGLEPVFTLGNYDNTINPEENLYSTLTHELGHYHDFYENEPAFADNPQVKEIYEKELKEFCAASTTEQQQHIAYFLDDNQEAESDYERVAETHAILYSNGGPQVAMRRLYLAQNFPKTIAAIMKLILDYEGVQVKQ